MLRTPVVHAAHLDELEDRSVVLVAAQLHDADGNTIFETSQLALALTITSATGATITRQCSVVSGSLTLTLTLTPTLILTLTLTPTVTS